MLVRSVGLSQLRELSSFSVDTSGLVDSPVEKGRPFSTAFEPHRRQPPCGYQVPAGRLEPEVHLHFPLPVRCDMKSGQFRNAVERIEYDPDTDEIVVLWRKTEA
jgi:hypothetical protein